MKFTFLAVGKSHDVYVKQGTDDFTKRISNYYDVSWQLIPPVKNAGTLSEEALISKEGETILKTIQKEDYLIALDEKGKHFSSVQFASFLQDRANAAVKNIVFLIGGAYGLDVTVREKANLLLSFSAFTFPHQLVRLILAEQVYRTCTIQRNEKYHHS